jgi:hypothetical protein
MNAGICPNEAELLAWADHAEGSEVLSAHVDACPACRQQLDEMRQSLTQVRLRYSTRSKPQRPPSGPHKTPASVGKYLVVGRIAGQRAFECFRGLHPVLHVDLRIDLDGERVPNIAEYREPIAVRAKQLMSIEHEHLSRVRDTGYYDDRLYLVADYGQEERLDQRLLQGAIAPDEAAQVVSVLAQAAIPLIEAGILPGEINPSGILLRDQAGPLWTDWGAAALLRSPTNGDSTLSVIQLLACLFVGIVAPQEGDRHDPTRARDSIRKLQKAGSIPIVTAKSLESALDSPIDSKDALARLSSGLSPRPGFWRRLVR